MPIYKVKGVKKDGLQKYNIRINFIDDNGKARQFTRSAYGSEAAKELERQLTDKAKNKKDGVIAKNITIEQLYEEYMNAKKYEHRESSIIIKESIFRIHILAYLKDMRIDKITTVKLQDWKMLIQEKNLSLNMKRKIFSYLKTLLDFAVIMEYIPKNLLLKVGNFKDGSSIKSDMNYYIPQEFSAFINAAKKIAIQKQEKYKNLSEWNYYVFFNIAFYTGLRKGEIYALKWSDINDSYLTVKRSISQRSHGEDMETPPKNKSSIRTLQMPLPLVKILNEHKERQKQIGRFSDDNRICGINRCLRNSTVQERRLLYAQMSGVKVIRIHDFRHSHVSVLANEGINIQEIARRLGHSKIEMTWNTYCHLYPREEEKAVEVLNGIE